MSLTSMTVDTVFTMVDRMSNPLALVEKRTARFVNQSGKLLGKLDRGFASVHQGITRMAGGAVVAVTAIAGGLAHIAKVGMEFDKTMISAGTKFPGIIRQGTEEFKKLEDAALAVGEATEFKASEGAAGLDFLAMAGFSANGAIAALPGLVDLATAASMDLAQAADVATDSIGAFGLASKSPEQLAKNLQRVNDTLVTTGNIANTSVAQLFEGMVKGGPVAAAAGEEIESFAAMAAALAQAGIKGAEGGTAMRNMYLELGNPSKTARKELKKLKVELVKTSDGGIDMIATVGKLAKATEGMSKSDKLKTLGKILGNRTIAPMMVMMKAGEAQIRSYKAAIEEGVKNNTSTDIAAEKRKGASGEFKNLGSAIEAVELRLWSVIRGPFTKVTKSMVDWLRANKEVIGSGLEDFIKLVDKNSKQILKTLKYIGIAVGVFYAMATAVKVAQTGLALYHGVLLAGAAIKWLWVAATNGCTGSMALYTIAVKAAKVMLWPYNALVKATTLSQGLFTTAVGKSKVGLGKMNATMSSAATGAKLKKATVLLGKAGLLGAALAVGYAFGTWLDHKFGISTMMADWLTDLKSVNDLLASAGKWTGSKWLEDLGKGATAYAKLQRDQEKYKGQDKLTGGGSGGVQMSYVPPPAAPKALALQSNYEPSFSSQPRDQAAEQPRLTSPQEASAAIISSEIRESKDSIEITVKSAAGSEAVISSQPKSGPKIQVDNTGGL